MLNIIGAMDMSQLIIAGHSFGGHQAFYSAQKLHRDGVKFKACLTLDPDWNAIPDLNDLTFYES
jgi:surfactin synthase thioesterase subunit